MSCTRRSTDVRAAVRIPAILMASLFLWIGVPAGAAVMQHHYEFSDPVMTLTGGSYEITMEGAWTFGRPGEPMLPKFGAQLLLPPGEVITNVEVIPNEWVMLEGTYAIAPGQPQVPLSMQGPYEVTPPDEAIYGSSTPFPGRLHDEPYTGLFRGYRIASFAIHPVEYVPATGELSYMRSCDVIITTALSQDALTETARMIRHDEATVSRLSHLVDNPSEAIAYASVERIRVGGRDLNPDDQYKYLIVTGDTWAGALGPLVAFETERGHKAGVFTKSWILLNYTAGVDDQADIRDFIIDAYGTWDIDYVLLVGDARDTNGIPHRGLYSDTDYGETDTDIPADMYYGCLDGSWNNDGDGLWGEVGEDDLYIEVGVGRACVSDATDLQNFITKTLRYQNEPIVSECDEALMVGELLWDEPTWGGDYKDEIKDGASTHGYTTVGFPPTMNVETLYDRDYTWAYTELITLMENGMNIVNHLGHCNVTYAMKMNNTDIPSFDNDGTVHSYNFVYSQGCYCGSFDNRTTSGGYTEDCYAEVFQTDDDGAAAIVMNSRYGWGMHQSTNGSSQYFDRQFFDAMFGERIFPLADINDDSKMDNIWAINYGANRWCYYELNVFGTPTFELWSAVPGNLQVTHPQVLFIGEPDMDFVVRGGFGSLVAGARVTVCTEDYSVYDTGVTNALGAVTLHPDTFEPGTLHIKVTAHDYLTFDAEIPILPPEGAYLVCDDYSVLDESGDDDGVLDVNETVGLDLTLENVGVEHATDVSALLSCEQPGINITVAEQDFPDIPAGWTGTCLAPYEIEVAGDVPDQQVAHFTVNSEAAEGSWACGFNLVVEAPVLTEGEVEINDSAPYGDASGGADAGESFYLEVWIHNTGHSDAIELAGTLSCASEHVVVRDASGVCPLVPMGNAEKMGLFKVEILPTCPEPSMISFQIDVISPGGFAAALTYEIPVGGWFDNAESDHGWTLGAAGDDASTGRWVRVDPVGTTYNGNQAQPEDDHTAAPGTICFVTGNGSIGGAAGDADVDGGTTTLLTPVFTLGDATSASIEYWRWYTNNLGNNPGTEWWDVDVTNDGQNWVHLEHTQASANSWTRFEFDLGTYVALTDQIQIRFQASDVPPGTLVEAAVDDFLLNAVCPPAADVSVEEVRANFGIVSCTPNPFNPRASIIFRVGTTTHATLDIYDVAGSKVRTLIDARVDAGEHSVTFDGKNSSGQDVASGIYFLRLETPEILQVKQITLLK